MDVELLIDHGSTLYVPMVEEGITWTTQRQGSPGTLSFSVVKDGVLNFTEGDAVRLRVDGANIFYGFVFTKSRTKEDIITVTAYDQLRYFKNKSSTVYTATADALIGMLCADFNLAVGTLEDTGHTIVDQVEENATLFDMVGDALDLTITNTGELYILYDDFGSVTLQNIANLMVPIVVDSDTAEDFKYTSSIDSDTYNRIRLYDADNPTAKELEVSDADNIASWGVLQYVDTVEEGESAYVKAQALLSLYNQKSRTLTVSNVVGDSRVRGGCLVAVQLDLGDVVTSNWMLVEKCVHTFVQNRHTMNLTLRGGEFVV